MKAPLTKSRAEWAAQFKPKVLRGKPIRPNAGLAAWYAKKLEKIAADLHEEVSKEIASLYKAEGSHLGYSQDASLSSQSRILLSKLRKRTQSFLDEKAKDLADQMIARSSRANSAAAHESLKELSGGLSLKTTAISGKMRETMKALIADNVSLIRSIGTKHHEKIEGAVMRSIVQGRGLADLVPEIEKIGSVTRNKARGIAIDQTKKINAAIGRQRMQDCGMQEFEWNVSGQSVVHRRLHQNYHKKIFRYDDPPIIDEKTNERGFPGHLPGCNCYEVPVIRFDEGEPA